MLSRDEYENQFKSELDEIKFQIEKLALNHRNEDRFLDLMNKEQKARLKLRELRSSSDDSWDRIKPDLERSYDDLNRAISVFH